MEDVLTRVERGAAWLDVERPEWDRDLDITTVDLADSTVCPLGRSFPDFIQGCYRVAATGYTTQELGFLWELGSFSIVDSQHAARVLTHAWRAVLYARRAQRQMSAPQPQFELVGV